VAFPGKACPIAHIRSNVTYSCAAEFTLRGSNGYEITVSGGLEGGENSVELSAEGRSGTVQYTAPGRVTDNGIEASFGKLGRVSVRFRPSGQRPPVVTSRLGSFVGTIRFRGERGYTRVSARRADGGIGDPLANTPQKLVCDFHESDAAHERELESVSLDASPSGAGVSFGAFRLFGSWSDRIPPAGKGTLGGGRYLFLALSIERARKLSIFRYAAVLGRPEDFVFDDALTTATVRPPSPFTGSGSFLRNPDGSTSWTGTLAVRLPGLGAMRLTGGRAELATVATHLKQLEEKGEGHRRR
jgi:hypothetical protein